MQQKVLEDGGQVLVVKQLLLSPLAKSLSRVVPKQNLTRYIVFEERQGAGGDGSRDEREGGGWGSEIQG